MREKQEALLGELADLGMSLARDLHARALAASDDAVACDLALAFHRISRSLRQTLALQSRLGLTPFRVLQNNNNLAVREFDPELRALCAAEGVAVVTYSPLGGGYLTGKHRNGVQPGSRFDVSPGHQNVYFNPVSERRLARLAEVSARTGHPMAHLALAWALHRPGVSAVLIGGRAPAHLDQAFAALELNDPALFAELESV